MRNAYVHTILKTSEIWPHQESRKSPFQLSGRVHRCSTIMLIQQSSKSFYKHMKNKKAPQINNVTRTIMPVCSVNGWIQNRRKWICTHYLINTFTTYDNDLLTIKLTKHTETCKYKCLLYGFRPQKCKFSRHPYD